MWLRVDYTLFRDPAGPGRDITERTLLQAQQGTAASRRARGLTISDRDPEDLLDTEEPADPILAHNKGVDLIWWRSQQLVDPEVVDAEVAAYQVTPDIRRRQLSTLSVVLAPRDAVHQTLNYLSRWDWPRMMLHREPQKYHAVLGGLQSLVVEPYTLAGNQHFVITTRRLMITPHGSITDNITLTLAEKVTAEVKTIEQPSRKIVMREMARLLRYPTGLLRGDVPLTVDALLAPRLPAGRNGRATSINLNSTSGCLRTAVKKMKDAGIK